MVKKAKSKDMPYKDNLQKEEPLIKDEPKKDEPKKEEVEKEKEFEEPKPKVKKSNKWIEEVKALQKKEGITYKDAMKKASELRKSK